MKYIFISFYFIRFISLAFAKIELCNSGIQSEVCKLTKDYNTQSPPLPYPAKVNVDINILDIVDVDENSQTIKLQIKVRLNWIDKRLFVNRTLDNIEKSLQWFMIGHDDIEDIWTPRVYIANAIKSESLESIGDSRVGLSGLFFQSGLNEVLYTEKQIVTFSCLMTFEDFPFDSHECNMILVTWLGANYRVQINRPTLVIWNSETHEEICSHAVNKSSKKLSMYSFQFESMEPSVFHENGFNYSMSEIKIRFQRTSQGRSKIFSSYHVTTGAFTLLSFVSFLIQPEQVAGRMGLLVSLSLVMINSYNSVDAPINRGFSTIEAWFVGTLAPVLFGLMEYGLVLSLQKLGKLSILNSSTLFKTIDLISLALATVYFIFFNLYFWL